MSEPWMDDALCAQTEPELFFPEGAGTSNPAKKICRNCEVSTACFKYALDNNLIYGVWGGRTPAERHESRLRATA